MTKLPNRAQVWILTAITGILAIAAIVGLVTGSVIAGFATAIGFSGLCCLIALPTVVILGRRESDPGQR